MLLAFNCKSATCPWAIHLMSQDGCHSSLITSSHNYIQIRKGRKEANRSLLICLFLIREEILSQKPPAEFPFGQNWVKWLPLDQSRVQENRMAIIAWNQMWFISQAWVYDQQNKHRFPSVERKEEMATGMVTTGVWDPSIFKCLAQAPLLVFKIIVGGMWIKLCFQKLFSIYYIFTHIWKSTHIINSSEPWIHGCFFSRWNNHV